MRFKQFAPGPTPLADARTTALPSCSRTRVLGVPVVRASASGVGPSTTSGPALAGAATNARAGQDLVMIQLDFSGKVVKSVAVNHGLNLPTACWAPAGRCWAVTRVRCGMTCWLTTKLAR